MRVKTIAFDEFVPILLNSCFNLFYLSFNSYSFNKIYKLLYLHFLQFSCLDLKIVETSLECRPLSLWSLIWAILEMNKGLGFYMVKYDILDLQEKTNWVLQKLEYFVEMTWKCVASSVTMIVFTLLITISAAKNLAGCFYVRSILTFPVHFHIQLLILLWRYHY